jgi:hypothetical protein
VEVKVKLLVMFITVCRRDGEEIVGNGEDKISYFYINIC